MNLIFSVIVILIICFLFLNFTSKLKIPSVVSLIIFGIFLTIPGFKTIFIADNVEEISILGDLGLLFLMFIAGLESSWKVLKKEEKESLIIMLFAFITSFFIGFLLGQFFNFSYFSSFIIGIVMSITAEATNARILLDLGKIKSRVGSTIVGAGLIDDIFGLFSFIIFSFILGVSNFKEDILIIGAIFIFFLGIITQKFARDHHITKKIELVANWGFIPFFFISMGIHFDIISLNFNLSLLFYVILFAIIGKIFGTFLAKPFVNFSFKQLYLIGWAMNSRGVVGLALVLIALRLGLIEQGLYSALVIMALITTLIFPFVLSYMIKSNKNIMD